MPQAALPGAYCMIWNRAGFRREGLAMRLAAKGLTAILSIIGVGELMYNGRIAATDTYRPLEVFTGVAVIYYLLAYPQSLGVNWLFDKFKVQE